MRSPKLDFGKIERLKRTEFKDIENHVIEEELSIVLSEIKKATESELETQLKNYVIIRLIAILEEFCTGWVVRLIDDYEFEHKTLFDKDEIIISLSSMNKLKEITTGKIVATSLQFHKSSDIDQVFSRLLNEKFLERLKKFNVKDELNPFVKNWDKFFEIFNERHKLVHTSYSCKKYNKKQIIQIVDAAVWFTVLFNIIIGEKIFVTKKDKFQKEQPPLYLWLTNNTLRKRKEIN